MKLTGKNFPFANCKSSGMQQEDASEAVEASVISEEHIHPIN